MREEPVSSEVICWVSRRDLLRAVADRIRCTSIVLDVGAGIKPQSFFRPRVHLCVEVHAPYVHRAMTERPDDNALLYLNCRWEEALLRLPDRSVDSVMALDFIEHLEKEEGHRFLAEATRVARKQVVLFTPLGYFPQRYDDPQKHDRWGMDGGRWQEHLSGWTPSDFPPGWKFVACGDWIQTDQDETPLAEPMGALWSFWEPPAKPSAAADKAARRPRLLRRIRVMAAAALLGRDAPFLD